MEQLTLECLLAQNLKTHPEQTAVVFRDIRYRWSELEQNSRRLGETFLESGLQKGSHVAIVGKNSVTWLLCFLACTRIGAVAVLVNPGLTDHELDRLFTDSNVAAVCLTDREKARSIVYGKDDPDINIWTGEVLEEKWKERQTPLFAACSRPGPHDILCMLFTSGTTARPKGVLLQHDAVMQVAKETVRAMGWTARDRSAMGLPLFHIFGLSAGFLGAMAAGALLCLREDGHSRQLMEAVEKYRCTILNGVPTMFLAMLRNPDFDSFDLSTLKSGVLAGAGITGKDYLEICRRIPFVHLSMSYGLTETSPSVTFSVPEEPVELKAASAGVPIPGVRISVRKPAGDSARTAGWITCQKEEVGEITVKGYNIMRGYFHQEAATAAAFDPEGWFHTGDAGFLDEEGHLHVTGRLKDVIIRSGENISPAEIEEVMAEHPLLEMVKAIGVPDPVTQEEIAICVVPEPGAWEQFSQGTLRQFAEKHLSAHKIPRYYLVFRKFPVNASGKIDGRQLKEMACKACRNSPAKKGGLLFVDEMEEHLNE